MNATHTTEPQETFDRCLEEVKAAKDSLDEARINKLLHDDPTVDKYWRRYFRALMSKWLIIRSISSHKGTDLHLSLDQAAD